MKIYDLAVNMIKLSGLEPFRDIDIVETGLRPGEKLFEELLVKSETLRKTDNNLVFVEKDDPISMEDLNARLQLLRDALLCNDDEVVRVTMHKIVPTYKTPEEINRKTELSKEMQNAKKVN